LIGLDQPQIAVADRQVGRQRFARANPQDAFPDVVDELLRQIDQLQFGRVQFGQFIEIGLLAADQGVQVLAFPLQNPFGSRLQRLLFRLRRCRRSALQDLGDDHLRFGQDIAFLLQLEQFVTHVFDRLLPFPQVAAIFADVRQGGLLLAQLSPHGLGQPHALLTVFGPLELLLNDGELGLGSARGLVGLPDLFREELGLLSQFLVARGILFQQRLGSNRLFLGLPDRFVRRFGAGQLHSIVQESELPLGESQFLDLQVLLEPHQVHRIFGVVLGQFVLVSRNLLFNRLPPRLQFGAASQRHLRRFFGRRGGRQLLVDFLQSLRSQNQQAAHVLAPIGSRQAFVLRLGLGLLQVRQFAIRPGQFALPIGQCSRLRHRGRLAAQFVDPLLDLAQTLRGAVRVLLGRLRPLGRSGGAI
jgi:hypothetical protein